MPNLGKMLFEDGVSAALKGDYATAMRLWRPLANKGVVEAQFNLGVMYAKGEGVPQDNVIAHMWFTLAATKGDADASTNRDTATAKMTPAQLAKGTPPAWAACTLKM